MKERRSRLFAEGGPEEVMHGEKGLETKLQRVVTRRVAEAVLAAYNASEMTYGEFARVLAESEDFPKLKPLAQKWVRKSPAFFGQCVVHMAQLATGEAC